MIPQWTQLRTYQSKTYVVHQYWIFITYSFLLWKRNSIGSPFLLFSRFCRFSFLSIVFPASSSTFPVQNRRCPAFVFDETKKRRKTTTTSTNGEMKLWPDSNKCRLSSERLPRDLSLEVRWIRFLVKSTYQAGGRSPPYEGYRKREMRFYIENLKVWTFWGSHCPINQAVVKTPLLVVVGVLFDIDKLSLYINNQTLPS